MLPEGQTKGYMLVRKMRSLFADYEKTVAASNSDCYQEIRRAMHFVDPLSYCGIGRWPLRPWTGNVEDAKISGEIVNPSLSEVLARQEFLEINGEDREEWDMWPEAWDYNKELIRTLDETIRIFKCLQNPADFEVIKVSRTQHDSEHHVLGYDVGYWGGDHFSLISDTVIMPQWHPPVSNRLEAVAEQMHALNEFALFLRPEEASTYLEFYRSEAWGESEDYSGQFCVIQVAEITLSV